MVAMAILILGSLLLLALFVRALARQDTGQRGALWLATAAVLPVALLLGELVARTLELAAPPEAYDYLTLVPALLGAGVGFLAVLASFVLAPPLRGRWRLDA